MRLALARFTVRRMMIAVAIVAIVLGVATFKKRRDQRLKNQVYFAGLERKFTARAEASATGSPPKAAQARLNYFRAMRRKWQWAASHPWESVEPDPPEPQ
jgi:hypothetical protein